jgi:hypothetical protein
VRGSPLIRALIVFLAILALGFPLRELTRGNAAPQENPADTAAEVKTPEVNAVGLQLTFTLVPTSLRVLHLGKEVWKADSPSAEMEAELKLEFPKEGVDLQFEIEWPGDTLAAMRAILTDPEGNPHEKTVWGSGPVTEVVTFP